MKDQLTEKIKVPFMAMILPTVSVSVILILASIYFIVAKGFNFGVDFEGGAKIAFQFAEDLGESDVRGAVESLDAGEIQIVRFGQAEEKSFLVKVRHIEGRNMSQELKDKVQNKWPSTTVLSEETVGPKVGNELRKRGIFAVAVTWLLIIIYVGVRFDFLFSPGALIALFHDIIITAGFFVFLDKEVNLPILAAALTIIGYSINDTIIVFDRIRENLKKLPESIPLRALVDISLNETLSRTIVTSLTVLFAVLVLFFLGGGVLHDFAFCMIIGVVVGTYSSIFIASPIYLLFNHLFPSKAMARGNTRSLK